MRKIFYSLKRSFHQPMAILVAMLSIFIQSCTEASPDGNPHIIIETTYGDIEATLFVQEAPKSCAAFLSYVDSGYYKRSNFYRILSEDNQPMGSFPASLIQGGLWATSRKENLPGIPHESTNLTGLSHINGTLSLARLDTGTATTEFFICLGNQAGFDFGGTNNPDGQGYAAFGRVVRGMDVVQKIYRRPEENQLFTPPVPILDIKRK